MCPNALFIEDSQSQPIRFSLRIITALMTKFDFFDKGIFSIKRGIFLFVKVNCFEWEIGFILYSVLVLRPPVSAGTISQEKHPLSEMARLIHHPTSGLVTCLSNTKRCPGYFIYQNIYERPQQ